MPLPDTSTLALFVTTALVLLVTPGPAVLYIVARSVDQGRAAGLASSAGLFVGGLAHVAAAALGLSAVLVSSAAAFTVVRLAGAAYLIWLGIRTWLAAATAAAPVAERRRDLGAIFRQGIVVNLFNPKAAVFFLAFLPQFVDVDAGAVPQQMVLLGLLFVAIGLVTDLSYVWVAGSLAAWIRGSSGVLRAQRRLAGTVYIALGLATAFGLGRSN